MELVGRSKRSDTHAGEFTLVLDGLKDLQRDLKAAGQKAASSAVSKAHRMFAKQVGMKARQKAKQLPGGGGSGRFPKLIKWRGSKTSATVVFAASKDKTKPTIGRRAEGRRHSPVGSTAAMGWFYGGYAKKWAPWLGNRSTGQRLPEIGTGYAIPEAIREEHPRIVREYQREIQKAMRSVWK